MNRSAGISARFAVRKWRILSDAGYYRDDSRRFYGKLRCKLVHARSKQQAMEKFRQKTGIKPLRAE